jgi:hypothetical protein
MVRDGQRAEAAREDGSRGGNPKITEKPEAAERARPITEKDFFRLAPAGHVASPEFCAAVSEWIEYRRRRRFVLTAQSVSRQMAVLSGLSPAESVFWIQTAIDKNWRGLYPPPLSSANRTDTAGKGKSKWQATMRQA